MLPTDSGGLKLELSYSYMGYPSRLMSPIYPPCGKVRFDRIVLGEFVSVPVQSKSTQQCANYTTWLLGIPDPQAHDPIAGLATSSRRVVFPREAARDCRHTLVMATLCQPITFVVHAQGPVELKAGASRLPPPGTTVLRLTLCQWAHKAVLKDPQQVQPHWIMYQLWGILCTSTHPPRGERVHSANLFLVPFTRNCSLVIVDDRMLTWSVWCYLFGGLQLHVCQGINYILW